MINSKILSLLAMALFIFSPLTLVAEEINPNNQIKVQVDGMVCAFCAQGIKSGLSRHSSIESSDVSLSDKLVTITVKQGMQLEDQEIQEIITNSGYKVVAIEREQTVDRDA